MVDYIAFHVYILFDEAGSFLNSFLQAGDLVLKSYGDEMIVDANLSDRGRL